jgi:Fels-1 Prophage Protein-like
VRCDTKVKTCTVSKIDKSVDKAHTTALFGEAIPAASAPAPGTQVVFSPEAGTLCDRKVGICADDQGISMALTEMYLGKPAQARLMALQKQNKLTPTYFVLSDGARRRHFMSYMSMNRAIASTYC